MDRRPPRSAVHRPVATADPNPQCTPAIRHVDARTTATRPTPCDGGLAALRDAAAIAAGVAFGVALLALAFLLAARPIDPSRPLDACETTQKNAPLTRACAKPVNRELPRAFTPGEHAR